MSGHVISQGILNLINPGFTNEKMEEPSELVFASFNQGTGQIIWKEKNLWKMKWIINFMKCFEKAIFSK